MLGTVDIFSSNQFPVGCIKFHLLLSYLKICYRNPDKDILLYLKAVCTKTDACVQSPRINALLLLGLLGPALLDAFMTFPQFIRLKSENMRTGMLPFTACV